MPDIVIFTDDPGWHGARLQEAFAQQGLASVFVSLTDCQLNLSDQGLPLVIPGFEAQLPIAAFVRGVPGGSLEEVVFYLDVLHGLSLLDVPVYNNGKVIERSVDKAMTSFLLQTNQLATPQTWVLRDRQQAVDRVSHELQQGFRVIVKPVFGSQGEGIRLIEKESDLIWMAPSQGIYYLQRFIDCQGAGYSDWRVFVINQNVVAAMRREGLFWLNNVARGATCRAEILEGAMAALALRATEALAMDYAGVDIIVDKEGHYSVIEVNSIPAWKGLQSICYIDIAQLLVADLLQRHLFHHTNTPKSVALK